MAVGLGFLAGLHWPAAPSPEAALSTESQERILERVVNAHFERSERLLAELANQRQLDASALTAERATAAELVVANRLYRRSSHAAGRADLATVLDALERLLLDLAHPSQATIADEEMRHEETRRRLEDLLFKLRVVSYHLRPPVQDPPPTSDI